MKLLVKGFFHLQNAMGGHHVVEVEGDEGFTLKDLMEYLSRRFGKDLTDMILDPETQDLVSHLMLLVNGKNYRFLPDRLNSPLKDGDEIAIFPPIAGG